MSNTIIKKVIESGIEYTVETTSNGDKDWCLNEKLHREDGPAIEWSNGSKYWYLNDKRHRVDGPAIEYFDGEKRWYLNGKCVYSDYEDNTSKFEMSEKMIKQIIKYRLSQ